MLDPTLPTNGYLRFRNLSPYLTSQNDIPNLLADLGDEDPQIRGFAQEELSKADESIAHCLVKSLELTEREDIKWPLCQVIAHLSPKPFYAAPIIFPVLEKFILDPEETLDIKKSAIHILGQIARDDEPSIKLLIQIIKEDKQSDMVKLYSLFALEKMGSKAVKELLKLSLTPTPLKALISSTLSQVNNKDYISGLNQLLDEDLINIWQSIELIEQLGRPNDSTAQFITQILLTENSVDPYMSNTKYKAALVLSAMGEFGIPYLTLGLKSKDIESRITAAWVLGKMRKNAKIAIDDLIDSAIKETDTTARRFMIWALGELRGDANKALQVLKDLLKTEDDNNKVEIENAIRKIS